MSTFTSALTKPPPDPTKHVKFTVGMVLGVDDFTQEFTYLSNRDQTIAGGALGPGTISGLQVTVSRGASGDAGVVQVRPGTAVTPGGQLVTVPSAQCADIDDWLEANADAVRTELGSPPGHLTLSIVLGYTEQQTDEVPIPATPDSTNDSLSAPSRVQDSFELELSATVPSDHVGQVDAQFAHWLERLRYTSHRASSVDELIDELRDAAAVDSPPVWPLPAWPAPPRSLLIPRAQAREYLRAAIATWVTELRPTFEAAAAPASSGGGSGEDSGGVPSDLLVVASLAVPVGPDGTATGRATVVGDSQSVILSPSVVQDLAIHGTIRPPSYSSIGTIVGAGRFELVRETEFDEPEVSVLFTQNVDAVLVPTPEVKDWESEIEEALARAHYLRLRLEHDYNEHHRYVITALPLVEPHGARHAIEEVSRPPHHGHYSRHYPWMLRLSRTEEIGHSRILGFSVQITDLGPADSGWPS
jgi:hypothetical protein